MSNDLEARSLRLQDGVTPFADLAGVRVSILENQAKSLTGFMYESEQARLAQMETDLAASEGMLLLKTEMQLLKAEDWGSPSVVGTLLTIWSVLKSVYEAIKWFVEFFHVKEILEIVELVRYVSPKFRAWTDKLLSNIRKLGEQIGIGAEGFYYLMHAMQSTLSATGSMLGKDWDWLESEFVMKQMEFAQKVSLWGNEIANDPIAFMIDSFTEAETKKLEDNMSTWDEIWSGLEKGLEWGETALENTEQLTTSLLELKGALPDVVRRNIPGSIWATVGEADRLLEEEIIPKFTKYNEALQQLNGILESQRAKAQELVERLGLPADYLAEIDDLDEQLRLLQEKKLDELSSREFMRQTEVYGSYDSDVIAEMDKLDLEGIPPGPAPSFMTKESSDKADTRVVGGVKYKGWQVGDY